MMIEHSPNLHVALLFSGYDSEDLRKDLRSMLRGIEKEHRSTLKDWDGTMTELGPVREQVKRFCRDGWAARA
jgi:hypothetical protein